MSLHGEFDLAERDALALATTVFAGRCVTEVCNGPGGANRATDAEATIDAGELVFIDAASLGVLVSLSTSLAIAGIRLRTRRPSAMLRRLSELCGLDTVLGLEPSRTTRSDSALEGQRCVE